MSTSRYTLPSRVALLYAPSQRVHTFQIVNVYYIHCISTRRTTLLVPYLGRYETLSISANFHIHPWPWLHASSDVFAQPKRSPLPQQGKQRAHFGFFIVHLPDTASHPAVVVSYHTTDWPPNRIAKVRASRAERHATWATPV